MQSRHEECGLGLWAARLPSPFLPRPPRLASACLTHPAVCRRPAPDTVQDGPRLHGSLYPVTHSFLTVAVPSPLPPSSFSRPPGHPASLLSLSSSSLSSVIVLVDRAASYLYWRHPAPSVWCIPQCSRRVGRAAVHPLLSVVYLACPRTVSCPLK